VDASDDYTSHLTSGLYQAGFDVHWVKGPYHAGIQDLLLGGIPNDPAADFDAGKSDPSVLTVQAHPSTTEAGLTEFDAAMNLNLLRLANFTEPC